MRRLYTEFEMKSAFVIYNFVLNHYYGLCCINIIDFEKNDKMKA